MALGEAKKKVPVMDSKTSLSFWLIVTIWIFILKYKGTFQIPIRVKILICTFCVEFYQSVVLLYTR